MSKKLHIITNQDQAAFEKVFIKYVEEHPETPYTLSTSAVQVQTMEESVAIPGYEPPAPKLNLQVIQILTAIFIIDEPEPESNGSETG